MKKMILPILTILSFQSAYASAEVKIEKMVTKSGDRLLSASVVAEDGTTIYSHPVIHFGSDLATRNAMYDQAVAKLPATTCTAVANDKELQVDPDGIANNMVIWSDQWMYSGNNKIYTSIGCQTQRLKAAVKEAEEKAAEIASKNAAKTENTPHRFEHIE